MLVCLCRLLLGLVGLYWISGGAQPCHAFDWSPESIRLKAEIHESDAVWMPSWFEDRLQSGPTMGLALIDCFSQADARISVSLSRDAWTQLGISGQMGLAKGLLLHVNCGMVLGESIKHMVSKTVAAMAALTVYFD